MMNEIEDEVMVKSFKNYISAENSSPLATQPIPDKNDSFCKLLFSEGLKHIPSIKELIFEAPDTNEERIQKLKEEISSGRYETCGNTIAMKMLASFE